MPRAAGLAAAAGLAIAAGIAPAEAGAIRCLFTEPSAVMVWRPAARTLAIEDPVTDYPKVRRDVVRGVTAQRRPAGRIDLVAPDGRVLLRLRRDGRGSDGMSDRRYPYSAVMPRAQNRDGGCLPVP
ncbi:hypothetical protein [Prosthecodimorpha staleyi]|uniref:Uncharacterized protein n=1 Tax=Prosthecodimorpha staleyi TaxID=2840188 RepID=A0A947D695_9HYPH|nr:hypothetical protein [Prosthecodimorpha staleyi]MBT9288972.1 hypothetical protein [Prosthecodimorpha staleyi]